MVENEETTVRALVYELQPPTENYRGETNNYLKNWRDNLKNNKQPLKSLKKHLKNCLLFLVDF